MLVAVALAASLMPLNSTMVAVALPAIGKGFGASPSDLTQSLISSYLLTGVVLQSPGGKLGDRLGHRRALAIGQSLLAVGATLGFFAPTLRVLAVARILLAAGGAILVPSATALLRTELPFDKRGRAFGAFGGMMAFAAAVGPMLGGELTRRFAWPAIFLANLPVLMVSATLAFIRPGSTPARASVGRPARFDLVGSLLLGAALSALVIGLRASGLERAALVLLGLFGFVPFALWERRTADPVVDFSLFRRPVFSAGSALIALQNVGLYAFLFELPHALFVLFGMDARATGRLLVLMMATMVVTAPLGGRLSDRFGPRVVALVGSIANLVGVTLALAVPLTTPNTLIAPLVLLGFGLSVANAPAQSAAMSAVPRSESGMAAGITSTLRFVGGIAGVTALGMVVSDTEDKAAFLAEHQRSLVVVAVAFVAALAAAFVLPGKRVRVSSD